MALTPWLRWVGSLALAGALTAAAAPVSAAAPGLAVLPIGSTVLTAGDRGPAVRVLQGDLRQFGFYRGPVNGVLDPGTATALAAFQRNHGLRATGTLDGATFWAVRAALGLRAGVPATTAAGAAPLPIGSTVLGPGDRGPAVDVLQGDLRQFGYSPGTIDGVFAAPTTSALTAFQRAHGLPATGTLDAATFGAILQLFGYSPPRASGSSGLAGATSTGSTAPNTVCGLPVVRTITMVATAYAPTAQDNYPYGAVDAFGKPLQAGDIAVDPGVIPLQTHLYIAGYHSPYLPGGGMCGVARDTGGAIRGNRIDIFINASEAQVNSFGIQTVQVLVLG